MEDKNRDYGILCGERGMQRSARSNKSQSNYLLSRNRAVASQCIDTNGNGQVTRQEAKDAGHERPLAVLVHAGQ